MAKRYHTLPRKHKSQGRKVQRVAFRRPAIRDPAGAWTSCSSHADVHLLALDYGFQVSVSINPYPASRAAPIYSPTFRPYNFLS